METKQPQHTHGELVVMSEGQMAMGRVGGIEKSIMTEGKIVIKAFGKTKEEAEANAQRIVKAVNEYDALVKENEELKEWKKQQIEITSPILEYMRNNAEKFNLKLGESIFKRVLELIKKSKRK